MKALAYLRINYKSDFILTLHSDAGWMTPFCIKFWTSAPSQAYFAGWDGDTYTHCTYDPSEPTKLVVQFDDHHLPIGDLKFQIAYHFTVADFPNGVEDEVLNQSNIVTEIDGNAYQVMLDFTGETAPEIQFSLPAYANEAQRIANEEQRIAHEAIRIVNEESRIAAETIRQQNEAQRIAQETARVDEFATLKSQSQAATSAANTAATLANEKAQLAADKAALAGAAATLANAKAQLAADKAALASAAAQLANEKAALAQQKAEYAQTQGDYAKQQGDYAKEQGDYAKGQGDTALADHQRAEADHGIAVDDHTQAGNDHTRAEADHGISVDDHTQAGNDHTRAESDHGIAADDHTQAGNDHTRAEADHGIAADDHTRAESDHTRAESDHAAVEVYVDSLGAFDISAYHATGGVLAKYADLTAALGTNGANIPDALRKGGMSVKFVHSSDNKYVQYRFMLSTFTAAQFANPANWQGVDDEPTAGSKNLVESGGAKLAIINVDHKIGQLTATNVQLKSGLNNLLPIGDVVSGDRVSVNVSLSFTPVAKWYISAFSNGTQIGDAKTVGVGVSTSSWDLQFNSNYNNVIICVSVYSEATYGTATATASFNNTINTKLNNNSGRLYTLEDSSFKVVGSSTKEHTMVNGSNPTISKTIQSGKKVRVSVQGMTGAEYASAGVNNSSSQTFLTFELNSMNNWTSIVTLTQTSNLFWWVCKGTSGEAGTFLVEELSDVVELYPEVKKNTGDIYEILGISLSTSSAINYGRNDIFSLGDVPSGTEIIYEGQIDFTPSEDWYLSIQSDEGEVVSYRISKNTSSFAKTYNFAANKTNVKIAISVYGSSYGNVSAICKTADTYSDIKKSVLDRNVFAYDVIKGCSGSGKTNDPWQSVDGTAGFTVAISKMATNLGGKISVASGQYLVSSPINLNTHCVNIEGSIWNYPGRPNGVYESNNGTKIKIASQNIPALKITTGSCDGFRISQIGFAGTISNGATKGIFDKSNPWVNCGILMESYHDQYEIRRVSCEGLAAGFAGNGAGMDAGIIECFNADGCNIGVYCENTNNASKCYYFKLLNNILSDCPAFGIYMNGKYDNKYNYYGAEIAGNVLVRNGGGFTSEQITAFGGDSECAAVYVKGLSYGSFHDNIIHNAGIFNNVSTTPASAETQTRKFCILDAEYSEIYGNQFMTNGTSVDIYGNRNHVTNNMSTGTLNIYGSYNSVSDNRVASIVIEGNYNFIQSNICTNSSVVINGSNNTIIVPNIYTVTDNGDGNTIIRLQ